MLSKRIIPCLDVKNNQVVKGIQFKHHEIIGDIISLASRYVEEGADELVFYDIEASILNRTVDVNWIKKIAEIINIPFCVAGGINNIQSAEKILSLGADKISINSSALSNPNLINQLSNKFGTQCVVISVDTWYNNNKKCYQVYQYTGDISYTKITNWNTLDWILEVQNRGAGEIVLNMMNNDGVRDGYDLDQLKIIRKHCDVPLIASGGAGNVIHFLHAFKYAKVDGTLAASVFHKKIININCLKNFLFSNGVNVRLCQK
ncbi:MAG: imidazole glycerol phosphate synthase subunit HisF [Enterobacterales bacterium]